MYRWLIILTSVLMLLGCSPIQLPDMATYTLASKTMKEPAYAKTTKTIAVSMPTASAGFETVNMAYVMTPYELQYFTRNRWVAPPTQMLVPIVVQALRGKGYYKAVIPPTVLTPSDYRLNLQILTLQQEFLLPTTQMRVEIQAILSNGRTNQVIASKQFSELIDVESKTPYAGVIAANRAVSKLTKDIASWAIKQ